MPRLAVYELRQSGLVLDVQSDLLEALATRIVAPLIPLQGNPPPAKFLNPVFRVADGEYVLLVQSMAAVRAFELGQVVADLPPERDAITRALDMVFQGF